MAKINFAELARDIVKHSGGAANIAKCFNCMTRVRMVIVNDTMVDIKALKEISAVMGVVQDENEGTLQVIVGPGNSNNAADEVNQILSRSEGSSVTGKAEVARAKAKSQTPTKKLLKHLANIFVPLIPALIAAGTLLGINNIIIQSANAEALAAGIEGIKNLTAGQVILQQKGMLELSILLGLVSSALFAFLPIHVGFTTAEEFGGNKIMGAMLGAITIAPQLSLIGLAAGKGGLIGVVLTVWLMCIVEKRILRVVPSIVSVVFTPILTIIIMAGALLFAIMPAAGLLSDAIVGGLTGLMETGGIVTGFVLSSLFPFLISLGLHHGLIPIQLEIINATGSTQLFAIQIMSNGGMVGAAIAVLILTTDPVMKKVAKGAIPTSILAVGEPTIFGVNIPAGFAFITGSIGAGFGGVMVVLLDVKTNGVGAAGMSAIPLIADGKYLQYLLSWGTALIAGFALTYVVGKIRRYDKEGLETPVSEYQDDIKQKPVQA